VLILKHVCYIHTFTHALHFRLLLSRYALHQLLQYFNGTITHNTQHMGAKRRRHRSQFTALTHLLCTLIGETVHAHRLAANHTHTHTTTHTHTDNAKEREVKVYDTVKEQGEASPPPTHTQSAHKQETHAHSPQIHTPKHTTHTKASPLFYGMSDVLCKQICKFLYEGVRDGINGMYVCVCVLCVVVFMLCGVVLCM